MKTLGDLLAIAAGLLILTALHQFWLGPTAGLHLHALLILGCCMLAAIAQWFATRS